MQRAIFISYRREDAPDAVGRVYDKLTGAFGEAAVFKDVDTLLVGKDFGATIEGVISRCRFTLALIGPGWAESLTKRRGDASDWVRIELEAALRAPSVEVVPVLLSGADMPSAEQLPDSLRPLLRLHAAKVRRDPDFHRDMSKLVAYLSVNGVDRSDDGSGAVGLWRELSQTEDIEDLRNFIDTFSETAQAFEARRRVDQLTTLKRLRFITGYLEHGEPEEDAGCILMSGVEAFERRWTKTLWNAELTKMRELAMECADFYDDGLEPIDDILLETPQDWCKRADKFITSLPGVVDNPGPWHSP